MLLRKYISHEKTENGWLIHGDTADVMLVFMTDDVVRIRVSFNRDFREESYTLVTTACHLPFEPTQLILQPVQKVLLR